jgi:hypothetical protein
MTTLRKLSALAGVLSLCACASWHHGRGTGETTGGAQPNVDCSTVRCAACPTGQHPALTPPDCCRCVPG